ncbi:MFS family permease [Arcanobacterium wilhelmae]|uniref:MFS family permease n=1 Tax=Arcanobacterium wilhelmae TaxID=1803177 RepID=A0ABT9NBU2_9ACTO|nr:MFS transporter [Arcanobacterium wilhelmae]MDP9801189.1 MFS family permease [Arcanobacterium wilhelmae]WFN90541.1 MFS transporter [Arcanobacterium wilhelmae]
MAGKLRALFADTRPLKSPDFRRLWLANIITVIGAQLTVVAVPAQIYDITGSSGMVGLAGAFGLVPLVIFGLYGGALADYFDRRRLLEFTTLGLIGTSALFWAQAAAGLNNVWVLLLIFSAQQAFFAINQPTRTAILPTLVPKSQIPAANALNMTVFSAGAIAGPLVGGMLIPVLGYSSLYLVDTLTLFATLYAVYRLPSLPAPAHDAGGTCDAGAPAKRSAPGFAAVLDGLKYLSVHQIVLLSFVVDLIAMIAGMPRALYPEVAHVNFGGPLEGGTEFALLNAALPIGALLGGMFSGWVSRVRRYGLAVLILIAIWGGAMFALGLMFTFAPYAPGWFLFGAMVALAVGGIADMGSASFRQGILLGSTNDKVRGRLQGVFIVVVAGGPRLADVVHGGAAELVGPNVTTWAGGLLVVLGMAVIAVAYPALRKFEAAPSDVQH